MGTLSKHKINLQVKKEWEKKDKAKSLQDFLDPTLQHDIAPKWKTSYNKGIFIINRLLLFRFLKIKFQNGIKQKFPRF